MSLFADIFDRAAVQCSTLVFETEWRRMLSKEDIGHDLDTEADLKAVHRRFGRYFERCFRKLLGTLYNNLSQLCTRTTM